MKSVVLPINFVLILILYMRAGASQDIYDGYYDLEARDAAYLCVVMDDYLKTGTQPSLDTVTPETLDKEMFTKGKPCWRFNWKPCDPATYHHKDERPCGWYQMENAPENECN